jgi:hypothetical protein
MPQKSKGEVVADDLTLPIWPGLRVLGYRTRSSAYDAAKHLPPEAFLRIGKRKKLLKPWVARVTSGKPAP